MKLKAGLVLAALMLSSPVTSFAQETAHGGYEELGKEKDWTAIRFKSPTGDGSVSCAIFSRPKESFVQVGAQRVDALRGERAAFITWEAGETVSTRSGVTSFLLGAPVVPKDAGHKLTVDAKKSFDLYGFEDRVYTRETDDKSVINAIRTGSEMNVRVKISDTREAYDVYSLHGVQAATNIAAKVCN